MEVLWSTDEPMSVRDVHEVLLQDGKIAYTTVMTVLDRLAKKSVVSRHQESRAWIYRPARSKAEFMAGELGQVLNEAGADRCEVLAALVPTLDPTELGALASALDRAASTFRSGRSRGAQIDAVEVGDADPWTDAVGAGEPAELDRR